MKSSIGSTAGRSDISSRLSKRNRKPPTCAACRLKKLRCDRTLPSCTNCLSRPEIEHCDYTTSRCSRWGGRSCRSQMFSSSSAQAPAQQLPTNTDASELPEADADADAGMKDIDARSRTTEDAGGEDQGEKASERTMREKLERLERMIATLMESKSAACYEKKQQRKDHLAALAEQSSCGVEGIPLGATGSQRLETHNAGESTWSVLLNEKINKWQQGLARYQTMGSSGSLVENQDKT